MKQLGGPPARREASRRRRRAKRGKERTSSPKALLVDTDSTPQPRVLPVSSNSAHAAAFALCSVDAEYFFAFASYSTLTSRPCTASRQTATASTRRPIAQWPVTVTQARQLL